jgi:exonuclease VII large subunit
MAYAEMGPGRSLAAVGQKLGKSRQLLSRWSSQHHWQQRVAAHDAHLARQRQRAAAEAHIREIEAHQERYNKTAKELHAVGRAMLSQVAEALQSKSLPLNVATLNTVLRTFQVAAELEAHTLNLDRLLPLLDYDDDDSQAV